MPILGTSRGCGGTSSNTHTVEESGASCCHLHLPLEIGQRNRRSGCNGELLFLADCPWKASCRWTSMACTRPQWGWEIGSLWLLTKKATLSLAESSQWLCIVIYWLLFCRYSRMVLIEVRLSGNQLIMSAPNVGEDLHVELAQDNELNFNLQASSFWLAF